MDSLPAGEYEDTGLPFLPRIGNNVRTICCISYLLVHESCCYSSTLHIGYVSS